MSDTELQQLRKELVSAQTRLQSLLEEERVNHAPSDDRPCSVCHGLCCPGVYASTSVEVTLDCLNEENERLSNELRKAKAVLWAIENGRSL